MADVDFFKKYLTHTTQQGAWRLYIRLWAELRNAPEMSKSLNFLNRYWVMAATYDGVAFALFIWVVVLADCLLRLKVQPNVPLYVVLPLLATLLLFAQACTKEAARYLKNQIEELVAAFAAKKSKTPDGSF